MQKVCLLTLVFCVISLSLWSECGIGHCFRSIDKEKEERKFYLSYMGIVTYTDFKIAEESGSYQQFHVRLNFHLPKQFVVGGYVPLTRLEFADEEKYGFSNPVFFGQKEFKQLLSYPISGAFGLQLEVPWGQSDKGLSSDHTELMGYFILEAEKNDWHMMFKSGARFSLGESHLHGGTDHQQKLFHVEHQENTVLGIRDVGLLAINPHDEELLLSGELGYFWKKKYHLLTSMAVEMVYVFDPSTEITNIIDVGIKQKFRIGSSSMFECKLVKPVSRDQRFEYRVSLYLTLTF